MNFRSIVLYYRGVPEPTPQPDTGKPIGDDWDDYPGWDSEISGIIERANDSREFLMKNDFTEVEGLVFNTPTGARDWQLEQMHKGLQTVRTGFGGQAFVWSYKSERGS